MVDLNEIVRGDRNWVERIVQLVPGFRGYYDRENRREADRMLRQFGCSKLDHLISELHEGTKRAPLPEKDDWQEVVNQAQKLRHELRHSDQGYSGFFDEVKWDAPERLEAIYAKDEELVAAVAALAERVAEGAIEIAVLREELKSLQRSVAGRRHAILELGSAD